MVTNNQSHVDLLLTEYSIPNSLIPFTSILCGIFASKKVYEISQLLSPTYFKVYTGLSKKQQIEWDNRAISTVHAVFITIMAIYFTFWSDLYFDNDEQRGGFLLYESSSLSSFVLGVSVGYFLSDLGMIFWYYPDLGGLEYVLHHLISMFTLAYTMFFGEAQFYAFLVLISEATTPSINLRWYFDAVGLKASKAYVVNGLVIFCMWLVARIFLFVYIFYHLFMHYEQLESFCIVCNNKYPLLTFIHKLEQISRFGFIVILTLTSVLSALNLIWFTKITRGMLKALEKKQ